MTNKELAQKLNISPAALSLILNNKAGVSEATRLRVIQEIKDLGYSHLLKIDSQSPNTSKNICFVVYKRHGKILDQHPFFLLIIKSIEKQAKKYGYNILFTIIDNKNSLEDEIDNLNEMNPEGIIIFATEMLEDDINYFKNLTAPFVFMDNDFSHLDINTISINNQMGTFNAVEHLVSMGHTKIGYLQSNTSINSFTQREQGYKSALSHFGIDLDPKYIFKINYSEEGSYQDFKQLLTQNIELPTAFISDDDTIASGAMKALLEKGISIPNDISIIGFNDRPVCTLTSPQLTSISVSKSVFGSEAVNLLVKLIENYKNGTYRSLKVYVGTNLVERESVKNT